MTCCPQLTVVGIGDDGLAGFIAFHPVEGGVEIDYIATEVASQGRLPAVPWLARW